MILSGGLCVWTGLRVMGYFPGRGIVLRVVPPADNSLVGLTELESRASLGQPNVEFAGHYGNHRLGFTKKFNGEIKTAVFKSVAGSIYVSYEERNGVWIVICNSWLMAGSVW